MGSASLVRSFASRCRSAAGAQADADAGHFAGNKRLPLAEKAFAAENALRSLPAIGADPRCLLWMGQQESHMRVEFVHVVGGEPVFAVDDVARFTVAVSRDDGEAA